MTHTVADFGVVTAGHLRPPLGGKLSFLHEHSIQMVQLMGRTRSPEGDNPPTYAARVKKWERSVGHFASLPQRHAGASEGGNAPELVILETSALLRQHCRAEKVSYGAGVVQALDLSASRHSYRSWPLLTLPQRVGFPRRGNGYSLTDQKTR